MRRDVSVGKKLDLEDILSQIDRERVFVEFLVSVVNGTFAVMACWQY